MLALMIFQMIDPNQEILIWAILVSVGTVVVLGFWYSLYRVIDGAIAYYNRIAEGNIVEAKL